MYKLRFPLEVGALIRGQVRSQLHKLKHDIEWEIDGSSVSVDEVKSLLSSTFYISVENINEVQAKAIKRSVEDWVDSCQ